MDRVQQRLDQMTNAMTVRKSTIEHVFGTLKHWMGWTHFLTRGFENVATEMSLTVLPIQPNGRLLDGQVLSAINERDLAETLNFHAIPAPASWKGRLSDSCLENEGSLAGYRQLEMTADGQGAWSAMGGKFRYSEEFGLERSNDESA